MQSKGDNQRKCVRLREREREREREFKTIKVTHCFKIPGNIRLYAPFNSRHLIMIGVGGGGSGVAKIQVYKKLLVNSE